jgi:hypothetical protein
MFRTLSSGTISQPGIDDPEVTFIIKKPSESLQEARLEGNLRSGFTSFQKFSGMGVLREINATEYTTSTTRERSFRCAHSDALITRIHLC